MTNIRGDRTVNHNNSRGMTHDKRHYCVAYPSDTDSGNGVLLLQRNSGCLEVVTGISGSGHAGTKARSQGDSRISHFSTRIQFVGNARSGQISVSVQTIEKEIGMDWMQEIMIEDLPESYQEVCRIVGIENALRLSEYLGGLPLYFPKIEKLISRKKTEYIHKHFNGSNHRELARVTEYSERWVYEILNTNKRKRKKMQIDE
jgi:Mor family transcriptional regulator